MQNTLGRSSLVRNRNSQTEGTLGIEHSTGPFVWRKCYTSLDCDIRSPLYGMLTRFMLPKSFAMFSANRLGCIPCPRG